MYVSNLLPSYRDFAHTNLIICPSLHLCLNSCCLWCNYREKDQFELALSVFPSGLIVSTSTYTVCVSLCLVVCLVPRSWSKPCSCLVFALSSFIGNHRSLFLFVVDFLLIILFSSIQMYIESVSQSRLWTCYRNSCCGGGGGSGGGWGGIPADGEKMKACNHNSCFCLSL